MDILHKVIIIGAGPSGIGASHTLHKLGIPHIILESRSEIGGRLRTTTIDGSTIHLGACYIHAPNSEHAILKIMQELNIKPLPNNYSNQRYLEEAGEMDARELEEGSLLHRKLIKRMAERAKSAKQDSSLLEFVEEFLEEHKHLPAKVIQIARYMMKFEAFFQGSDLQHLSLIGFGYERTGEDYIPPGGYFNVLKSIYNSFNSKVIFNQKVVGIDYSKEYVTITTQTNQVYKAKYLISSLPLGVLQKKIVQFTPSLPKSHLHSIENFTCGIMNKIYLKFEQDFWTKKGDWNFLFTKEPFKYNVIVNEAETSKNVMCVKVAGFQNLQLFEKSDQQIVEQVIAYLKRFYKQANNVKLKAFYITRWQQDEHAFGSYCTLKPGQTRQNVDRLRQPIDNKIWFVGEHCNPNKMGFVHGAFETGQRAASQIAQLIHPQAKL